MIKFRKPALLITSLSTIIILFLVAPTSLATTKTLQTKSGETYTVGSQFNELEDEKVGKQTDGNDDDSHSTNPQYKDGVIYSPNFNGSLCDYNPKYCENNGDVDNIVKKYLVACNGLFCSFGINRSEIRNTISKVRKNGRVLSKRINEIKRNLTKMLKAGKTPDEACEIGLTGKNEKGEEYRVVKDWCGKKGVKSDEKGFTDRIKPAIEQGTEVANFLATYVDKRITTLENYLLKAVKPTRDFILEEFTQTDDFLSYNTNKTIKYSFLFTKGSGKTLIDTVGSIYTMIRHPIETGHGLVYVAFHIPETAKALVEVGSSFIEESFSSPEKFTENLGRVGGEILLIAVPASKIKKTNTIANSRKIVNKTDDLLDLYKIKKIQLSSIVEGVSKVSLDRVKNRLFGLHDRTFKIVDIKAFGSRTKGTFGVKSDVDILLIVKDGSKVQKGSRSENIINVIKSDFKKETGIDLDLNIFEESKIGSKTKFDWSDLKNF